MTLLLNESGEFHLPHDGWYHLVKAGEFPVRLKIDAKTKLNEFGTKHATAVQVLDAASVEAMASTFSDELLIDYDHESLRPEGSSEAAGWMQNVAPREDGLWVRPRWSDTGTAALKGGRYRYLSPVWLPSQCEVISAQGDRLLIRPKALFNAGVTNNPNLKGISALSNRRDDAPDNPTQDHNVMLQKTTTIALLTALGLPSEGVTDETVLAQLPAITNRLDEFDGLKSRYDALLKTQIESDLTKYSGVIANDATPKWREALLKDREGALALLGGLVPAGTGAPVIPPTAPITNRAAAQAPAVAATEEEALAADEARASAISNRAAELRVASPTLSMASAYRRAEAELAAK